MGRKRKKSIGVENQKFCKNPSFEQSTDLALRNSNKSYLEEFQNSLSIVLPLIKVIEKYSKNIAIFFYRKVFDKNGYLKKNVVSSIFMTYIVFELFSNMFSKVDANPINSIQCNALTEGPNFYNLVMDSIFEKLPWLCKHISMDSCYNNVNNQLEKDALYTYYTEGKDSLNYIKVYAKLYLQTFQALFCNIENKHENFGRSGETCSSKLICLHEFYDPMIEHCPNGELWKSRVEKGLCNFVYQLVENVRHR